METINSVYSVDIKAKHENDIDAAELAALRTFLTNVEHKISTEFEFVEVKDDADWTPPAPQPMKVSTTDTAPLTTKLRSYPNQARHPHTT